MTETIKIRDPAMEDIIQLFKDTCLYKNEEWDKDSMLDTLQEEIHSLVDCETPSQEDLVRYYEDDFWEDVKGQKFGRDPELTTWEDVRDAYYNALRDTVLHTKAYDFIEKLEKSIDSFIEFIEELNPPMDEYGGLEPKIAKQCPYGWAAHSYEKMYQDLNFHVWAHHQIDGLQAVAVEVLGGIWLYYAWE